MTNLRKQVSAKTAWARLSERNRRLRETLERIAEAASEPRAPQDAVRLLRLIRDSALMALQDGSRNDRAA